MWEDVNDEAGGTGLLSTAARRCASSQLPPSYRVRNVHDQGGGLLVRPALPRAARWEQADVGLLSTATL